MHKIKSEGIIDFPAQTIFNFLSRSDLRTLYDPMFECGRYLKVVGLSSYIYYSALKRVLIVTGRDILLMTH